MSESRTVAVDRETKRNYGVLLVFSKVTLQLLLGLYGGVSGHGRLVEPPSRASMWRYGYPTKPDFYDNQMWCGGYQVFNHSLHSIHHLHSCCAGSAKLVQGHLIDTDMYRGVILQNVSRSNVFTFTVGYKLISSGRYFPQKSSFIHFRLK